ncbi:MAG: NADH-quinone oxidoreductase subunit C [Chloroflexi bacterium]|nr:NADH-quinone oxidoreductase subunit C [Chloroflexota bacterium]
MTDKTPLQWAVDILAPWTKSTNEPEPNRLDVNIDAADLPAAVKAFVLDTKWGYLAAITGLDLGVEAGELEALYHFCSGPSVVTLRIRMPRTDPSVPSLFSIIPSVTFYERELMEMFGVTVVGSPNTDRLFLPDDWPAGIYPLRKDFDPSQIKNPKA